MLGYVLGQWLNFDRGDEEYVQISSRASYGFTDESFTRLYRLYLTKSKERIYTFRRISLCHSEMGWYVKHKYIAPTNKYAVEDVYFVDGAKVYIASYSYPETKGPSPVGERAIESLCAPLRFVAKPLVLPVKFDAPSGWFIQDPRHASLPRFPGMLAYFVNPNRPYDAFALMRSRAEGEIESAGDKALEKAAEKAVKQENVKETMLSSETFGIQPLCNNHTGWLFKYTVASGGKTYAFDEMMLFGPVLYTVVYVHLASRPAFRPASAALSTLCPIEPSPTPAPTQTAMPTPTVTTVTTPTPTPTPETRR